MIWKNTVNILIKKEQIIIIIIISALLREIYQNGSHPMDESTLKLIVKSTNILEMGGNVIDEEYQWGKKIHYYMFVTSCSFYYFIGTLLF